MEEEELKMYEAPTMQNISLETIDVITLSLGSNDYDPEINSEQGQNPWSN